MLTIESYNKMRAKNVAFTGLGDVVGGKLWFCIRSVSDIGIIGFNTKNECERYIKDNFQGDIKKTLLSELKERKGRAYVSL